MKFLHSYKDYSIYATSNGRIDFLECRKLIIRLHCQRFTYHVAFFNGFFNGFSAPTNAAHLAIEKEQSRENFIEVALWVAHKTAATSGVQTRCQIDQLAGESLYPMMALKSYRTKAGRCDLLLYFPNTSIRQFLKVLAMSTLTTSDLKIFPKKNWTYVYDHQSDRKVKRAKANSN